MKPLDASTATVSLTVLTPFLRLLDNAGPAVAAAVAERSDAAFARWGISRAELEADRRLRLPHGLVAELTVHFSEVLGDASAPLRAGAMLQAGDYELLEYLCGSCGTLGESIACLGRYYPLLIGAEHTLFVDGDRAEARFRIAPGLEAHNAMHEFALASNFAMAAFHVQPDAAQLPIEICFTHKAPPYQAVFESVFFVPVRFECEHNAIVFPTGMLAHPLLRADPNLHAVLTRQADHELAALTDQSAFPAKVREAIELQLTRGAALDAVAEDLHMSAGALRSRLKKYGLTYSAVLDHLRSDHAKRALHQSQLSFAEVAQQLGFAHPPAFHRAFRRWYGLTPSAYRDALAAHPTTRFLRGSR